LGDGERSQGGVEFAFSTRRQTSNLIKPCHPADPSLQTLDIRDMKSDPPVSAPADRHKPDTVVLQPKPGIGDMIWHLPTLKALAANDPSGKIDLITHEKVPARALLAGEGIVGRILYLPMRDDRISRGRAARVLLRALSAERYKTMFILHHSCRYALAARMAGVPNIYGWGLGFQRFLLTQPSSLMPSKYASAVFPLELGKMLLGRLNIPFIDQLPQLHPADAALAEISRQFSQYPKPWVGFGIGSTEERRIWPQDRFAAVADALWERGYRSLFLLCATHERRLAEEVVNHCQLAKPVMVTNFELDLVIALISQCAFNFCNDSSLMNVSTAVGVPVYTLFGTAYRFIYSPLIRPIVADGDARRDSGVAAISLARALARLRGDRIID